MVPKLFYCVFSAGFTFTLLVLHCEARKSKADTCLATGLDVLRETRNIKRFRATFDLETRKVYYKVRFCKKFSMCFASSIDQHHVDENIVNKIESWTKIIRVIQGKGSFMPYIKNVHAKEFGGPRDYYNCTKRFYIITYRPTKSDILGVTNTLPSKNCPSEQLCTRTCLHKTEKRNKCHEVRIVCNFKCSHSKRRTERDIRPLLKADDKVHDWKDFATSIFHENET